MTATAAFFNNWKKAVGGAVDLTSFTLKATLHTSAYAPNVATQAVFADTSNEVGNTNGYTTGGVTLGTVNWTLTGATAALTAANTVWTASGGTLGGATLPRYMVLRAVGTFNTQVDPLLMYILMDNSPADVTVTVGNTLTAQWSASGIFSLS